MVKKSIEYIEQFFRQRGYTLLSKQCPRIRSKLEYLCPKGHRGYIRWIGFQRGASCVICNHEHKKISLQQVKEAFEKQKYQLLSNRYINNRTNLEYRCSNDHQGQITWSDFQQGHRCPKCCHESRRLLIGRVSAFFKSRGYVLLSKQYRNSQTKLDYLCPKGHKGRMNWNCFRDGQSCPTCYSLSFEEVRSSFQKKGYQLLSIKYIDCRSKLDYLCPKGHKGKITWNAFQQGEGCFKCKASKGEDTISQLLFYLYPNEEIIRQKSLGKGKTALRLDFYIPNLNLAIEYDGIQHSQPVRFGGISIKKAHHLLKEQQKRDRRKSYLCTKKGIRLVRFSYKENLNIEQVKRKLNKEKE